MVALVLLLERNLVAHALKQALGLWFHVECCPLPKGEEHSWFDRLREATSGPAKTAHSRTMLLVLAERCAELHFDPILHDLAVATYRLLMVPVIHWGPDDGPTRVQTLLPSGAALSVLGRADTAHLLTSALRATQGYPNDVPDASLQQLTEWSRTTRARYILHELKPEKQLPVVVLEATSHLQTTVNQSPVLARRLCDAWKRLHPRLLIVTASARHIPLIDRTAVDAITESTAALDIWVTAFASEPDRLALSPREGETLMRTLRDSLRASLDSSSKGGAAQCTSA